MAPASEKKRVQESFFVGSHPPQGVSAMRRRRRWLYRSEPERTEEALRQTIAELCQALSADRLQQVLRAARYAAEGRNFVLIDLDLWRKPEWRPVLQRLLEEGEPPCPDR
jgi:3-methyladenine DNA glycosylase/8-oxoguanine DNA glycosylase